ncbi:MAG: hypothetical protein AABX47_00610 [Nanoarchaeota archaeon]
MAEKPEKKPAITESDSEVYELLPHKDILELKEELKNLKAKPTEKNLTISMVELSTKLDRLIEIFEDAQEELKVEEGAGLSWQEKMKPLLERMDKVLEQNSEIARGLVGLSDQMNEFKETIEKNSGKSSVDTSSSFLEPFEGPPEQGSPPSLPPLGQPMQTPGRLPPLGAGGGGYPLPPPPRRK